MLRRNPWTTVLLLTTLTVTLGAAAGCGALDHQSTRSGDQSGDGSGTSSPNAHQVGDLALEFHLTSLITSSTINIVIAPIGDDPENESRATTVINKPFVEKGGKMAVAVKGLSVGPYRVDVKILDAGSKVTLQGNTTTVITAGERAEAEIELDKPPTSGDLDILVTQKKDAVNACTFLDSLGEAPGACPQGLTTCTYAIGDLKLSASSGCGDYEAMVEIVKQLCDSGADYDPSVLSCSTDTSK